MAEQRGDTSFTIDLERPRSGPNQGQWRARLSGRKDPFLGKTPLSACSLACQSIAATMKERDGASQTKAAKTKAKPKAKSMGKMTAATN